MTVESFDSLRLACVILSPFLVLGMLTVGWALKGDRGYGCLCVVCFGIAAAWGNVQRIHETATGPTYVVAAGIIFGLLYIGRVSVTLSERRPGRKRP